MSKTVYLQVAIRLSDDADTFEVIENCDYSFTGDDILSHEIVGIVDCNGQTIY